MKDFGSKYLTNSNGKTDYSGLKLPHQIF